MRDHDELRLVRIATQKLDEARDVRIVERRLDLVEEVERAWLGEEEREQERDRAECLLTAREQREPGDLLARRTELHLDAVVTAVLVGDEAESSLASRKERACDVLEVARDGGERLVEPAAHRLGEFVA